MNRFRPDVERMTGYVPGEQPQQAGWIKLNTNENPYPPSPRVVAAIEAAAQGRLNIYPDPLARRFCEAAAQLFDVDADWILAGNGSDEILTILVRSFVDAGEQIAYPYPSYVLYETLAQIQGARVERMVLEKDWSWDFSRAKPLVTTSRLVFVPNPNSPSGNCWPDDQLGQLVPPEGVLVLDEAYGDFRDDPSRGELLQAEIGDQIVVTRTLSKSYSLAGIRFGFAVAHPDLIAGMRKVKDSYNCNALSLAAATAAIEDQDWMQENAGRIRDTRSRLTGRLTDLGFDVNASQANFVWAKHPRGHHRELYQALKDRRILVRFMEFSHPGVAGDRRDGLRITVGTDEEVDQLLDALKEILAV